MAWQGQVCDFVCLRTYHFTVIFSYRVSEYSRRWCNLKATTVPAPTQQKERPQNPAAASVCGLVNALGYLYVSSYSSIIPQKPAWPFLTELTPRRQNVEHVVKTLGEWCEPHAAALKPALSCRCSCSTGSCVRENWIVHPQRLTADLPPTASTCFAFIFVWFYF